METGLTARLRSWFGGTADEKNELSEVALLNSEWVNVPHAG